MDVEIALTLIKQYKEVFDKNPAPNWAVQNKMNGKKVAPSIPFIGKSYSESKCKILIYASAENLRYYEKVINLLKY